MFYKLEPAIWLPGPRAIFLGLPRATSKGSFLLGKRHEGISRRRLRVDAAIEGHPRSGRFWSRVCLALLFRFPHLPVSKLLRTLSFWG